jgi:hypothetical protein
MECAQWSFEVNLFCVLSPDVSKVVEHMMSTRRLHLFINTLPKLFPIVVTSDRKWTEHKH